MLLPERSKFGLNELLGRTYLTMTPQLRRLAYAAPQEQDLRRDEPTPNNSHDATMYDTGTYEAQARDNRTTTPRKYNQ